MNRTSLVVLLLAGIATFNSAIAADKPSEKNTA